MPVAGVHNRNARRVISVAVTLYIPDLSIFDVAHINLCIMPAPRAMASSLRADIEAFVISYIILCLFGFLCSVCDFK
jgi:hypothetical protein